MSVRDFGRALLTAVLAVLLSISPAAAENYAVLIGASNYALHPEFDLEGPSNDVASLYSVLLERGFADERITILSDDIDGRPADGRATRANILSSLERAVSALRGENDFLFVFFSGHGSTMPAISASGDLEPDGLEEVFLPEDIGARNFRTGSYDDVIVDNDLRDIVARIAEQGAKSWLVFDTCHSSDMIRGANSPARARFIPPEALGVPSQVSTPAAISSPTPFLDDSLDLSGVVSFSAALSGQLALEQPLPDKDGEVMGIFTFALVKALERYPLATYRQVAEAVAYEYDSFGPQMPAPFFEGDLDQPVFGTSLATAASWRARDESGAILITAGVLQGLAEGAIVALHPFGDLDSTLGYARVAHADLNASQAAPIAWRAAPVPTIDGPLSVTLEERGLISGLRIARLPDADLTGPMSAILAAVEHEVSGFRADWVDAGADADVHLRLGEDGIYLLARSGEMSEAGRIVVPMVDVVEDAETVSANLRNALWTLARYHNLLNIAAALPPSALNETLQVRAFLLHDVPPGDGITTDERDCSDVPRREVPEAAEMLEPLSTSPAFQCDVVYLQIQNDGLLPVDLTVLYADALFGISAIEPGGRIRIDPSEISPRLVRIRIQTWGDPDGHGPRFLSQGIERVMVIAVERDVSSSIPLSFAHLAQPTLAAATEASREALREEGVLALLMNDALFSKTGLRQSASFPSGVEQALIKVFRLDLVARTQ